jgi:ATP-dependent RNA helicase DeaD
MKSSFSELGINAPILKSITELNITIPTEIQEKTIPVLLNKKEDFVGLAKTGTGKTAAFGLPLIQMIDAEKEHIQALIIVPTRELGHQIFKAMQTFAKYSPKIVIASTCGGIPIKPQIEQLLSPTHILIATPGRLIDLIQRKAVQLDQTNLLVIDEADEMVSILKESLDEIVSNLPKKRRTFLFSATMPGAIKQLIQNYMSKSIIELSVDLKINGNNEIDHQYVVVEPIEKLDVLMHFLLSKEGQQGIIFCKTKAAVNKLAKNLAINRFSSGALHGSLTQPIRDRIMEQFRNGHINLLIATDLVARGIDIVDLSFVVNYHLPDVPDAYIHRSGRTGRAGAKGVAITILQKEEIKDLELFQAELGLNFKKYIKPDSKSLEDNHLYLWSKQIFKTKPNQSISPDLKEKIKTIFHHLTKDELIEKLIANVYSLNNKEQS